MHENIQAPGIGEKSPAIAKFLEATSGRSTAHEQLRCIPPDIGCGRQIGRTELETWPQINFNEYKVSGWCKECQDRIFRDPEEEQAAGLPAGWTPEPKEASPVSLVDENGRRSKPDRKFRKIAEPNADLSSGDPQRIIGEEVAARLDDIDVVTSESAQHPWGGVHYPVVDIDVPIYVIPSNGPHKYALYIDHPVEDEAYFDWLDAGARLGIIEPGYAEVSRKRGYTAVRPPWVNKPAKVPFPGPLPQEGQPF